MPLPTDDNGEVKPLEIDTEQITMNELRRFVYAGNPATQALAASDILINYSNWSVADVNPITQAEIIELAPQITDLIVGGATGEAPSPASSAGQPASQETVETAETPPTGGEKD